MKKLILLIATLGVVFAVIRRTSAAKGLAQVPAAMMGRMMEHMPDN